MKYIKLFLLIVLFSITNVNASSISYNWNIDSNKKIHENIIYQIEETTQNNYLNLLLIITSILILNTNILKH